MNETFTNAAEARAIIGRIYLLLVDLPFNSEALLYFKNLEKMEKEFASLEVEKRRWGKVTRYEELRIELQEAIDYFSQWITFMSLLN